MGILFKDQFKKLLKASIYPIVLGFILFVIISSYISIHMLTSRLVEPVESFTQNQNLEDFHITLGQIRFESLTGQQRLTVCQTLQISQCVGLDESNPVQMNFINRIIQERIYSRPDLFDTLYDPIMLPLVNEHGFEIERSIFMNIEDGENIYRFITINETINLPFIHQGRLPENRFEIAVYEDFAKANNLSIGDSFQILHRNYEIVGYFYAAEYILPTIKANALNYNPKTQSLILTTPEGIFSMSRPFTVKYQMKGDFTLLSDTFDVQDIYTQELHLLGRNMQMVQTIIPLEYNMRVNAIYLETNTAKTLSDLFLSIFITFSFVLILLYLKHYIDEQKEDLTILTALGYSKSKLAISLLTLSIVLSSIIILAMIFGLIVSYYLFETYSVRYQMPHAAFTIDYSLLIRAVVFPIFFMGLFTYIYSLIILSNFTLKPLMTKTKMLFIAFRRNMISLVLFVFVSTLFLFSLFTRNMITDFKNHTMIGNDYTHSVVLSRFTNTPRPESEPFTTTTTKLVAINNEILDDAYTVQAYGISQDVTLKKLIDNDLSNNALLLEGFIITEHAAMKYNVTLGDTLSLRFGSLVYTMPVVGINNDLIESAIYINQADLNQRLGFPADYFNGYYTMLETINDPIAIRVVNYEAVALELETLFSLSNQITFMLMTLALIVSLLMFYFMTLNRLMRDVPNFLTLKALGYYDYEMYMRYFLKTWIGLMIAFILSYFIVNYSLQLTTLYLYETLGFAFYLRTSLITLLFAFIAVTGLIASVTYFVYKKLSLIDLSTILKA